MSTLSKNIHETEKQVTLKLAGELGLNNSEELKGILQSQLKENRLVRIAIDKAETLDLSAIQLLYAYRKERQQNGKETLFETDFSQSIAVLIKHSNIEFLEKE
ncbi:MAG: STAS domain-containing protein [Salinivirgaceae bacterium]|nr:STAS domain-containing protein [Salinivirgaceae bacterium]MDD4746624.1 STAS domain-containing protein [Salinivirgaceae bacterium]MDY0279688.1 STAS domain-containing protein [Salinivirgaceae bacterium]